MTRKELKEMDLQELLLTFYSLGVTAARQAQMDRGITKKHRKTEEYVVDELCKRLDLDKEAVMERVSA